MKRITKSIVIIFTLAALTASAGDAAALELAGVTVTPHMMLESMRYRVDPEPADGARVQMFLHNDSDEPLTIDNTVRAAFSGKAPETLLETEQWAWHDMPSAAPDKSTELPPGAMTVWTFNSRKAAYGTGAKVNVNVRKDEGQWLSQRVALDPPKRWLSAVTFLGPEDDFRPGTMVVHIANESDEPVDVASVRLWVAEELDQPRAFLPQPLIESPDLFNGAESIPPNDRGGFVVETGPLPLRFVVVQVELNPEDGEPFSIWGQLKIKTERFDISGGWVGRDNVKHEPFLKALKRIHVNTAHLGITPGYSDTELYEKYPLKYFNRLQPFEIYDTDEMLPNIHAVEFLGEPQYGGGTPVPPQEVWTKLHPYAFTRLWTSLTHSEERIWRDYAGLSDYPHYDAYRVSAPSADAWWKYDRWEGQKIWWGAPLETIGDMCRSLRELNRPMPCAIWSQGPHEGWGEYGGRERTSPTPDEIRVQAYHALSTRITSLYWFNLSLNTLVEWRDTLGELGRIGREMRMLDEFMLEGDAYQFERLKNAGGDLDWNAASIAGPRAALLYAVDLDYDASEEEKVFKFGPPRNAQWEYRLPAYLTDIADVFRVDADGVYDTNWSQEGATISINDKAAKAAVYVATPDTDLRDYIESKRRKLIEKEEALNFDPAKNDEDFQQLVQLKEAG